MARSIAGPCRGHCRGGAAPTTTVAPVPPATMQAIPPAIAVPGRGRVRVDDAGTPRTREAQVGRGGDRCHVDVALIAIVVDPEACPVRRGLFPLLRRSVQIAADLSSPSPEGGRDGARVGSDGGPATRIGKSGRAVRQPALLPPVRRRRGTKPAKRLSVARRRWSVGATGHEGRRARERERGDDREPGTARRCRRHRSVRRCCRRPGRRRCSAGCRSTSWARPGRRRRRGHRSYCRPPCPALRRLAAAMPMRRVRGCCCIRRRSPQRRLRARRAAVLRPPPPMVTCG